MKIGTREVGPGHPTFIVAEIGSNHGGSFDAALALIGAAADAGADAVKFQLWNPDKMYDPNQFPDEYASAVKWRLSQGWLPHLAHRAHECGLAFGCSAFDFDSLDAVDAFVDFHKVASIEATWGPFVYAVERKNKPTLISIGMQDIRAGDQINYESRDIILNCTVAYPCELEDVNLRARKWNSYNPRWGLSDHTTHPTIAPCAAVALGACVIEKHLRLGQPDSIGMQAYGAWDGPPPDWGHSLWPAAFKDMVDAVRLTEKALGSSDKRIRPSEEPYLKYRRGPRGLRGA